MTRVAGQIAAGVGPHHSQFEMYVITKPKCPSAQDTIVIHSNRVDYLRPSSHMFLVPASDHFRRSRSGVAFLGQCYIPA